MDNFAQGGADKNVLTSNMASDRAVRRVGFLRVSVVSDEKKPLQPRLKALKRMIAQDLCFDVFNSDVFSCVWGVTRK